MAINLDHVTEQITVTETATNASLTVQPKGTGAFNIAAGSSGVNISNGGTVTAITRTALGGYTSVPSVALSAPTTAGGVQATATCSVQTTSATIASGGTGYTVGDVITLVGGTPVSSAGTFRVATVSSGVITSVDTPNFAAYTAVPTNPVSITGGTGSSATLNVSYFVGSFTITNAGSGYVEQPTITFSGGGGSGAAAYVVIGSPTTLRSLNSVMSFYTPAGEGFRISNPGFTTLTDFVEAVGGSNVGGAYINVGGSTTNANLYVSSKGTGSVNFFTGGGGNLRQALVSNTAGAVNYLQFTGAATGSGPTISAQGSDTNADLNVLPKGTGYVTVGSKSLAYFNFANGSNYVALSAINPGATAEFVINSQPASGVAQISLRTQNTNQAIIAHTASAVNYVQVTGAATTGAPVISSQGSDSDIGIVIRSKGIYNFGVQNGSGLTSFVVNMTAGSIVNYLEATASTTGNAVRLSAQGSDTNIPLVLQPKGTGALQAQQTDSTATGGNARGANAVDWQTSRDTAAKVASGQYSVIGGGNSNRATTYSAALVGGLNNNSSGGFSFLGGGLENGSTSSYSFLGGGFRNNATGPYNFVGGGYSNVATSGSTVTTQSATMNGTTAVTLSASNASIKVGQYIGGTFMSGYPNDTYVAAISGTSLTLSQAASGSGTATLSFFTPHGVVVGGGNNQATGSYSFIGGGGDAGTAANRNSVVSDWGVVVGGQKNTITATGTHNTISGGYGNLIQSNTYGSVIGGGGTYNGSLNPNTISSSAAVISGGINNSNSSFVGFIGGGFNNNASGSDYATIVNGQGNTANSSYSFISGGYGGTTRGVIGYHVFPASNAPVSTTQGTQQAALLVLGRQTTDATATVLPSNSAAASTTNQVILPNNSAYFFTGEVVAGVTGGGNTKGWTIEGVIKRGANAASTALVGTPTVTSTYADAGASTWVIAVTADTTNGGLAVTFTGQASTTIRTVAQIRTTEMTY